MKSRILGGGLLVTLLVWWARSFGEGPPPAEIAGPCPIRGQAPCVVTLRGPGGPSASSACSSHEWSSRLKFPQSGKWSDSNGDGSWETVLEVRLDPARDCGCARFKVYYDEAVSGWTVHVGNSPTNNGHGGDEGTTQNAAEVQVLDKKLTVYTASWPVQHRVDKLLDETLAPLGARTIEFEVCEQALGVEILPTSRDPSPPKWRLETLNSKLLFSLGPEQQRPDQERGASIYAAFNRVIHRTTGAASHGRVGSGVRRVEISLIP